jgi:cell division control protein 6
VLKNSDNNSDNNYPFSIDHFYKEYLNGPKVFKNRSALEPSFIPDELPHRNNEIEKIAKKTACALTGDTPPNLFCYGMTGTGKTATIRYVSQKLARYSVAKKPWWVYINCSIVSTPYRILAHIYNTIIGEEKIPPTGLPKDTIYKKLLGLLDNKIGDTVCFLVLDEIDLIADTKGGNEILYDLTRINENLDKCSTCVIGISNKLKFKEFLDPRVLSSLGEENITFHPYDANQLRDILNDRAEMAFYENVLKEGVIAKIAAIAAKEDGDARKAMQILKKAGEIAQSTHNKLVTEAHVNKAQNELEQDHIMEYIKGMPLQAQVVLTAIYLIRKFDPKHLIISGNIYEVHSELANKIPGVRGLTRRRLSDYIKDLNAAGIISANKRSMGHYGLTKIIRLDIDFDTLEKVLCTIEMINSILDYKPVFLQSNKVRIKNNIYKKLI